jgi:hypothetical protein
MMFGIGRCPRIVWLANRKAEDAAIRVAQFHRRAWHSKSRCAATPHRWSSAISSTIHWHEAGRDTSFLRPDDHFTSSRYARQIVRRRGCWRNSIAGMLHHTYSSLIKPPRSVKQKIPPPISGPGEEAAS